MVQDKAYIQQVLGRLKKEDPTVTVERSEASRETKNIYHWVATDTQTGRIVIGTGNDTWGDDFDWGQEIDPSQKDLYL